MGDHLVSDMEEAQRRLAALLGREEPVSAEVLRAAVEDPLYAMHLMVSRSSPELLAILLQRPPAPRAGPAEAGAARKIGPTRPRPRCSAVSRAPCWNGPSQASRSRRRKNTKCAWRPAAFVPT